MGAADYGIDLSEQLSTVDRQFLLDRNYWQEVQSNDDEFGIKVDEPEAPFIDPTAPLVDPTTDPHNADTPPVPETVDGDDVTVEDLHDILDARGVEYPSKALKAELLALVNGETPDEEEDEEDGE